MKDILYRIKRMQTFLEIKEKPSTIYNHSKGGDPRGTCSYDEWLRSYERDLQRECERILAKEYMDNLGKRLFEEKFPYVS